MRSLPDEDKELLEERHRYREKVKNLAMLRRVEDFYKRYPDMEGKIKPDFAMVLESRHDPKVEEQLFARVPFDEIELPKPAERPVEEAREWSREDREVIEYLRNHYFPLGPRTKGVSVSIEHLRQSIEGRFVRCPLCGGELQ
jgi:hypothetical protein